MPEAEWTDALPIFAKEQPALFGSILLFIMIAEGESVGHSGDNFRGKSTKKTPGDLNYDPLGIKEKVSADKYEKFRVSEIQNGRAAMLGIASMFAFEAIPGSVPIMNVLGAS